MEILRVHLAGDWQVGAAQWLEARLGDGFAVTQGPDIPAAANVLVSGRPADEALDQPSLRAVIVPFAGIPEATAEAMRIRPHLQLYNLHFNANATAELAIGLLLAAARRIPLADRRLRAGFWLGRQDGSTGVNLAGKQAAIYGYGAVGRQIGRVLSALGMGVIGIRRTAGEEEPHVWGSDRLREALSHSHALVVSAPLTDETRGAIGREELELLLEPRLVVNVGRGPIIDEAALYEACHRGIVAAAGIDVWYRYPKSEGEPTYPSDQPFHELDNVVMSPHRAGDGDQTEEQRLEAIADLVGNLAMGVPVRQADPVLGY